MRFNAKVIQGGGRGKKIGFPTANLDKTDLKIKYGVYAAKAEINGKFFSALLHYGPKKTFNKNEISCELHILGFDLDIYGKSVKIIVGKKVRNIVKFKNTDKLKEQIGKDIKMINPNLY